MRRIRQTFSTVTPESAEQGDFAETGWIDEEGAEIAPDEFDIEEHDGRESDAVVALAVKHITQYGCVEPSNSPSYCRGTWYTTADSEKDYTTGEETQYSFHLDGFTEGEEQAIYRALTAR